MIGIRSVGTPWELILCVKLDKVIHRHKNNLHKRIRKRKKAAKHKCNGCRPEGATMHGAGPAGP